MSWKLINGNKYYYQSIKEGRRVRSLYVGAGELAVRVAEADRRRGDLRREATTSRRSAREALEAADRSQAAACAAVGAVVRLAMASAGYHRPGRGPWRRRRMAGEIARRAAPAPSAGPAGGESGALVLRVLQGDESALPDFRRLLAAEPARMLATADRSLTYLVEEAAIDRIAGDCLFTKATLPVQMEAMRRDLAGPDPSPVVRLLASRAALCWLETIDWDMRAAREAGATEAREDHLDRMRGRAVRRHLAALQALAQVARLGVASSLRVTIENQQVNIGKGERPGEPS